MDQECPADASGLGHVDRLVGGDVTAFHVVEGRVRQRRLADKQVGPLRDLDQLVAGSGVAGVDEAGAVGSGHLHAPGRDVAAPDEVDPQVAEGLADRGLVIPDLERVVEEGRPLADRGREVTDVVAATGREQDGQSLRLAPGPREQVAQADDVDVVVGVEVAADDTRQ